MLVTCTAYDMVEEHSQEETFSFTGMSGIHTSNHLIMSFDPLLPSALRFIPHELIGEVGSSSARELTVGYEPSSESCCLCLLRISSKSAVAEKTTLC